VLWFKGEFHMRYKFGIKMDRYEMMMMMMMIMKC